jgi:hypothetical protein
VKPKLKEKSLRLREIERPSCEELFVFDAAGLESYRLDRLFSSGLSIRLTEHDYRPQPIILKPGQHKGKGASVARSRADPAAPPPEDRDRASLMPA